MPELSRPPIRRIRQYECGSKRIDTYSGGDPPCTFIGHGYVVIDTNRLQPIQFPIEASTLEEAFDKIDATCQVAGDKFLAELRSKIQLPSGMKISH